MKAFHIITGLPRSGSTLLANVLAQNPDIHASSTSALAQSIGVLKATWSVAEEVKSDLAHDRDGAEAKLTRALNALVSAWYDDRDESVIADKSRRWIALADDIAMLWPDTRLICCVRDPREVFASVLRQHGRYPVLTDGPQGETVFAKADRMFSLGGVIGGPMTHIEDALRKRAENVVPLVYERFVADPERELRKVYAEMKLDWYDHDFEHVENQATDLDALALCKFPHDGSGKVEAREPTWQRVVPSDIAKLIAERYAGYMRAFGYD